MHSAVALRQATGINGTELAETLSTKNGDARIVAAIARAQQRVEQPFDSGIGKVEIQDARVDRRAMQREQLQQLRQGTQAYFDVVVCHGSREARQAWLKVDLQVGVVLAVSAHQFELGNVGQERDLVEMLAHVCQVRDEQVLKDADHGGDRVRQVHEWQQIHHDVGEHRTETLEVEPAHERVPRPAGLDLQLGIRHELLERRNHLGSEALEIVLHALEQHAEAAHDRQTLGRLLRQRGLDKVHDAEEHLGEVLGHLVVGSRARGAQRLVLGRDDDLDAGGGLAGTVGVLVAEQQEELVQEVGLARREELARLHVQHAPQKVKGLGELLRIGRRQQVQQAVRKVGLLLVEQHAWRIGVSERACKQIEQLAVASNQ